MDKHTFGIHHKWSMLNDGLIDGLPSNKQEPEIGIVSQSSVAEIMAKLAGRNLKLFHAEKFHKLQQWLHQGSLLLA